MKLIQKMATTFHNRKRYTYADLNDWMLALVGIPSFLVGAYYLWVSGNSTLELVTWSKDHDLTWDAILVFVFLGLIALSGLYFASIARRCYELIYERNFK